MIKRIMHFTKGRFSAQQNPEQQHDEKEEQKRPAEQPSPEL
jgi:hypothetical protein